RHRQRPRPRRGAGSGTRGRRRAVLRASDHRGGAVTSAIELAAAVRRGDTTATSLAEGALAAIAAGDGAINAFLHVDAEGALAAARRVDAAVANSEDPGPLAGVPVALKDNLCTRGVPTTAASRILADWRPPYTTTVVDRLVGAGAVPVAKTNLDEFAMGRSEEHTSELQSLTKLV